MKKFLLIFAGVTLILSIAIFFIALIISFKFVKQTTDLINADLKNQLKRVVRIPDEVQPTHRSFQTTIYSWEMETNQNEITTVIFKHDTGFLRNQNKIVSSLEMDQVGDPSLFNKILPAIIADKQALISLADLKKADLGPNKDLGYNKTEIFMVNANSQQVSKITWEFDKETISVNSLENYQKLSKYPEGTIKALYWLQRSVLILLSP